MAIVLEAASAAISSCVGTSGYGGSIAIVLEADSAAISSTVGASGYSGAWSITNVVVAPQFLNRPCSEL